MLSEFRLEVLFQPRITPKVLDKLVFLGFYTNKPLEYSEATIGILTTIIRQQYLLQPIPGLTFSFLDKTLKLLLTHLKCNQTSIIYIFVIHINKVLATQEYFQILV